MVGDGPLGSCVFCTGAGLLFVGGTGAGIGLGVGCGMFIVGAGPLGNCVFCDVPGLFVGGTGVGGWIVDVVPLYCGEA